MLRLQLPRTVDPLKAAKRELVLTGQVSLKDLPRIIALMPEEMTDLEERAVTVEFQFNLDQQHVVQIKGNINTVLSLRCERCLGLFDYPVSTECLLSPVENELANIPSAYEPILLGADNMIDLWGCIEDELLLAVPFSPMHPDNQCQLKASTPIESESSDSVSEREGNPFTVLKRLKQTDK